MTLQLAKFYGEVIKEFVQRLNKKYQNRDGLDSNLIDIMHNKISQKMKNPQKLFQRALIDQSQEDNATTIEIHAQIQRSQIDKQDNNMHLKHEVKEPDSQESDDLQKFEKQRADEVKIQNIEVIDQPQKQQAKQQYDNDEHEDSASEQLKQLRMDKAYNQISMHIVGTYSTKSKKHRARDQTTKIQLENVFIKVNTIGNFANQICFSKVICEFSKTEGEDIRP